MNTSCQEYCLLLMIGGIEVAVDLGCFLETRQYAIAVAHFVLLVSRRTGSGIVSRISARETAITCEMAPCRSSILRSLPVLSVQPARLCRGSSMCSGLTISPSAHGLIILLQPHVVLPGVIRNREHIAGIAADRPTQLFALVDVFQVLCIVLLLNREEVVFQVLQRVRLEVGEESDVVLVFELVADAEGVQGHHLRGDVVVLVAWDVVFVELVIWRAFSLLRSRFIFVIADIFAATSPSIGILLSVFLG